MQLTSQAGLAPVLSYPMFLLVLILPIHRGTECWVNCWSGWVGIELGTCHMTVHCSNNWAIPPSKALYKHNHFKTSIRKREFHLAKGKHYVTIFRFITLMIQTDQSGNSRNMDFWKSGILEMRYSTFCSHFCSFLFMITLNIPCFIVIFVFVNTWSVK